MCLAPKTWWLKDGSSVTIACQECRQCIDLKTHDWVGRNIAESKTSLRAHAITLTYGRDEFGNEDHVRAKVLTYSDVQKYFKLLRRHGYPCRYFLAGEYGPLKGRCHWHFIVYWKDRVPAFAGYDSYGKWSDNHMSRGVHKVRFNHQRVGDDGNPAMVDNEPAFWWPHGWSEVSEGATVKAIKYVTKYIRKDDADFKQSKFMMSKQPPLGAAYFAGRAERYVAAGLAPQGGMGYRKPKPSRTDALFGIEPEALLEHGMGGYKYGWSDVTYVDKQGVTKQHEFQLRGASLEYFLDHYLAVWSTVWPGRKLPASRLVEEYMVPGTWKLLSAIHVPFDMLPDNRGLPTEQDRQRALERVRWRVRHEPVHGDLPLEFEVLRPEFEARARQIAFHRSEYKLGKKR